MITTRVLEELCVIVVDKANYLSSFMEKILSTKMKKADIIEWLQQKNISHNPSNTVPEILSIVKELKEKYKMHELGLWEDFRLFFWQRSTLF